MNSHLKLHLQPDDIIYSLCQFLPLQDICNLHLSNRKFSKIKEYTRFTFNITSTKEIEELHKKFTKATFNLQIKGLTNNNVDDVTELLKITKNIKTLTVSKRADYRFYHRFNNMFNALKVNTSIKELYLNLFNINGSELVALAENKTIYKLNITNNYNINILPPFIDALKVNTTLLELNLFNAMLMDDGLVKLAEVLKENNTLQILNIAVTRVGYDGIVALADALKVNTSLIELDLTNNNIYDNSIELLADALKVNKTLKKLYLNSNMITNIGAEYLGEAFKVNNTLQELYLERCNIHESGVLALANGYNVHKSLIKLDLNEAIINGNAYDSIKFFDFSKCVKRLTVVYVP
jgi:Ran GTPase-activating protein (RanGAP) involved in mRNA processing and transport